MKQWPDFHGCNRFKIFGRKWFLYDDQRPESEVWSDWVRRIFLLRNKNRTIKNENSSLLLGFICPDSCFFLSLIIRKSCSVWNLLKIGFIILKLTKVCFIFNPFFEQIDLQPEELNDGVLIADYYNRDSNKGIVNSDFTPYTPLMDNIKKLNEHVYELTQFFDK